MEHVIPRHLQPGDVMECRIRIKCEYLGTGWTGLGTISKGIHTNAAADIPAAFVALLQSSLRMKRKMLPSSIKHMIIYLKK